MPEELSRRELQFTSLPEVVAEARHLQQVGYQSIGNWNLAQVCGHCGNWMRYPVDGFPKPPFFIAIALSILRLTVGKSQLRKILASGKMPAGKPTMPESVPNTKELDEKDGVDQFEKTVERFKTHKGDWHTSPLFGVMDKETLTKLNLVHCAHHFSFLLPKEVNES